MLPGILGFSRLVKLLNCAVAVALLGWFVTNARGALGGVEEKPALEAELRKFAALKYMQAGVFAHDLQKPMLPEVEEFFRAVQWGDWQVISNRFEAVKKRLEPGGDNDNPSRR